MTFLRLTGSIQATVNSGYMCLRVCRQHAASLSLVSLSFRAISFVMTITIAMFGPDCLLL